MKIFKIVQEHYVTLGISPSQSSTQKLAIGKEILYGFMLMGYFITSQFVYIYLVANSFFEYIEIICALSGTIIVFICFVIIVLKKTTVFECINLTEKLINTSNGFGFDSIQKLKIQFDLF